jgi:acid phosphatase family membrane protein YuiD
MLETSNGPGGLQNFLKNPVFLSAATSLFMAQFIKAVIGLIRSRVKSLKDIVETLLWRTGGMPSSHSALVVALTTSIALVEGTDSSIFTLSMFFSLIVIRDALGVRRAAGMQARAINAIQRDLEKRVKITPHPVKEVQGHTFPQVLVGGLLGFFLALAFCIL